MHRRVSQEHGSLEILPNQSKPGQRAPVILRLLFLYLCVE